MMINGRKNGRWVIIVCTTDRLRLLRTSGELRGFVVPDLFSKYFLDQLLCPFHRRDSGVVTRTEVVVARSAVERNGGKYSPSTIRIAALYRPELDHTFSGSRDCTRTRGGQLCICRHDLPTTGTAQGVIYKTCRWRAIPALDWISSEMKDISRFWIIPDPEDLSGCFPSKRTKIMERRLGLTAYQAGNSFIQPCGDFVRSSKMNLLDGR